MLLLHSNVILTSAIAPFAPVVGGFAESGQVTNTAGVSAIIVYLVPLFSTTIYDPLEEAQDLRYFFAKNATV